MSLLKRIEQDLVHSMKAHDVQTVSTLRMLQASVKNAMIAARTSAKQELDDADIEQVVKSEVKKLKDSLVDFTKASRQDLIDKANQEVEVLQRYLPEQLNIEAVQQIASETIEELKEAGDVNFGKAMKSITAKLKGAADGKVVADIVKKLLN